MIQERREVSAFDEIRLEMNGSIQIVQGEDLTSQEARVCISGSGSVQII